MAAGGGEEALWRLSAAEPPLYLSPSAELSGHARAAAQHLYASLLPFCPKPKPPLDELLADESFDAEQIWSQIDLLSRPVVSMLRREVRRIERDAPPRAAEEEAVKEEAEETDEDEEEDVEGEGEEEEENGEDEDEDEGEDEEEEKAGNGVEDKFLKISELEEYLEKDEEREYGGGEKEKDEEDDDDEDNNVDMQFQDLDGEADEDMEDAKYEDFFGRKKKRGGRKRDVNIKPSSATIELRDGQEELDLDDEQDDDSQDDIQENGTLSTHEKQRLKIQSKIEMMEKANLEPKFWTMQGEVTAAKRPKNSALEVDLDFERNMRPPPAMTEEQNVALEDLIKKRIIEGRFDSVQRAPALPSKAPKELKELDENKSKKGLAELYEEDYAQQTGLVSAPLSTSDELQNEASNLFQRLCVKLDALSHFHFAPKLVIEDMYIPPNAPAFAMEEVAPIAVSDAAMLAPEEVFRGKGDIKEDTELTQVDRKRRRAKKKRKFKAESAKREAKKARQNAALSQTVGNVAGTEDK